MSNIERTDIAIIGAGMVGASLVHLLKPALQQGAKLTLIERQALRWDGDFAARPPSFDGRATAIAYGSQQILQSMGVWSLMEQRACPIEHIQVSDQGHMGVSYMHNHEQGAPALGYIVENAIIGQGLLSGLEQPGVTIEAPRQVSQVVMDDEGALLTLDNGTQLHTKLLVLADGARSSLAAQLGIRHQTEAYGTHALVTQVQVDAWHRHWAYERFSKHGPIAFLPLNKDHFVVVWALPDDDIERVKNLPENEFLEHLQAQIGLRIGKLIAVGQRASYPLSLVRTTEQVRRSLVLLGNAAHSLHPVAGQGFNLSLRDASILAEHINRAIRAGISPGDLSVLEAYQQQQAQDQFNTIQLSHWLPKIFGWRNKPAIAARNLALLGLNALPWAKRLFTRHAMGLGHRAAVIAPAKTHEG